MMKNYDDLDKRLSLLEQKLDLILTNHLAHMQADMNFIKKFLIGVSIAVVLEAVYIITTFNVGSLPLQ
jgi:Mg2+ and Co2+ transporter CorA